GNQTRPSEFGKPSDLRPRSGSALRFGSDQQHLLRSRCSDGSARERKRRYRRFHSPSVLPLSLNSGIAAFLIMKYLRFVSLLVGLSSAFTLFADPPSVRLKELVSLEGVRDNQLIGYGIVVGLAGTGDKRQTLFTAQSLTNMLQQMGVAVPP